MTPILATGARALTLGGLLLAMACGRAGTDVRSERGNGLGGAAALTGAAKVANTCPDAIGDSTLDGTSALTVTHGQVALGGGAAVNYTTTAGYLPLYASGTQSGAIRACLFFFAYTRDDHAGDTTWPVSFLFNGGPGAASYWVHLGGLGPQTMAFGPEGITPTAATVASDADSPLSQSDLVFIDPINTGYSRVASGGDPTQFNGLDQDADSIGDFIQGYLTQFSRTASPKFLIGESYSGMRLPVLGRYLDEKLNIKMTGIVFLSPWLDAIGDTVFGPTDPGDDLPYIGYLPEYATIAWYHNKLAPDLQAMTLDQIYTAAQTFADTTYLTALAAGDDLPADQRTQVLAQLNRFTSLPATLWDQANLRATLDQFRNGVLADTGEVVAYYDGRMGGKVADPVNDDPYDAFDPLFNTAETTYFPGPLNIKTDLTYSDNDWSQWPGANPTGGIQGEYLGVLGDINTLMTNNPDLLVHVVNGYYDLVCPAAEDQYMIRHLEPAVASRIVIEHYPSGHPIYFNPVARTAFTASLATMMHPGKPVSSNIVSNIK